VPEPILHSVSRALVDTDIQVISFPSTQEEPSNKTYADFKPHLDALRSIKKDLNALQEDLGDTLRKPTPLKPVVTTVKCAELRIDWADSINLAFDKERYYLMTVEKQTEYYAVFSVREPFRRSRCGAYQSVDHQDRKDPTYFTL
jgi:hypothetical protein